MNKEITIEWISFINGTPRQRHVFHTDALGSVTALTGEDGGVAQEYTYTAFGEIKDQTGTDMNRITYTAREAIGDALGFYYYRNRVMDPTTGRFTTEDPIGFIDGPNRYVYVKNRPVSLLDARGLSQEDPTMRELFKCLNDSRGDPIWDDLEPPSVVSQLYLYNMSEVWQTPNHYVEKSQPSIDDSRAKNAFRRLGSCPFNPSEHCIALPHLPDGACRRK